MTSCRGVDVDQLMRLRCYLACPMAFSTGFIRFSTAALAKRRFSNRHGQGLPSTLAARLSFLCKRVVKIVEHLSAAREPLRIVRRRGRDTVDQSPDADRFITPVFVVPE